MAKYVIDESTLTAIADSIREKTGSGDSFTPAQMASEILNISTAENGTPTPTQEKTVDITENGTHFIEPDEGYALSLVTANVDVPPPEGYIQPSGTKNINENGTHDVTEYASVRVAVRRDDPIIQPLEITENGTYTAPDGVDGFSPITVNVSPGITETWTFTMEDGTEVVKKVVVV